MRVISGMRASGKTHRLIEMLFEDSRNTLIVAHTHNKGNILRNYPSLEGRVYSVADVQNGKLRGLGCKYLLLDEVGEVLQNLLQIRPSVITATGRSEAIYPVPEVEKQLWTLMDDPYER